MTGFRELVRAAIAGDEAARSRLDLLLRAEATLPEDIRCLLCGVEFSGSRPAALVLLTGLRDVTRLGFANALCDGCADTEDRLARVTEIYRQHVFVGDMRVIPVSRVVGHA
jgi:hypothetical protein